MIGTKLFSYILDDGSTIEFTNAMSGYGRVYVNGEKVSKKRGLGTESHLFSYNDSEYQLNIWPLLSFHGLGFSIELIKDEKRLVLYGKESKPNSWKIFLAALIVGILIGVSTIFFLES